MGLGRNWSEEEKDFLREKWGERPVPYLAAKLNRSEAAILVKAQVLHLGPMLDSGDYITMNQLFKTIYGRNAGGFDINKLMRYGFPIRQKRVNTTSFRIVNLDEFWEWAESNQTHIDFSRMEPGALGCEPSWMAGLRSNHFKTKHEMKTGKKWSGGDDITLKRMIEEGSTIDDLCRALGRSSGAIYKRIQEKGLPRPTPEKKKGKKWTAEEYETLEKLCIKRVNPAMMIQTITTHSEKSIRGKLYCAFGTEDIDVAAKNILAGIHISEQIHHEKYKTTLKKRRKEKRERADACTKLANALQAVRLKQEWGEYWQRDSCMNWDDHRGCLSGCTNCDDCDKFWRIPPQYCKRCGKTFFERKTETFCSQCRAQRLSDAQRKWARLNRGRE